MRVAAYVRVSTPRQVELQTIEHQLQTIHRYAKDKGWDLAEDDVFRDDGHSGASLDRPALDALRDKVRIRELDAVVLLSPDRLARNYVHQMVLIEELEKGGCRVEFIERPMSSEPDDQLLLQIRGAVAEYERTLIKERMRRGKLAKLKAGLLLPWTRTPYGYRADPDRPRDPDGLRLDEEKAAVVAEIFAMYLEERASLFGVSEKLRARGIRSPRGGEVWTVSSLRFILTNPVYTGKVYAGRTRNRPPQIRRSATHPIGRPSNTAVPVAPEEWIPVTTVEAIVTQEQFDRAKEKLSKNKAFASRNNKKHPYLLRALLSCGRCELACSARALRNSRYYVCAGKKKRARTGRDENCPSRYAPAGQLDDLVWKDLCEVLTHPGCITDALQRAHGGGWLPQELEARRENLREGRAALKRQLERLTEAYLGEVIPLAEYRRRRQELEQKDEALEGQQRQLQAQADRRMELSGVAGSIEDFCARVQGGLEDATFEQRRRLVELLVDRVIVTDEEVEIRYVIPTDPSSEHVSFCHLRIDYSRNPQAMQEHTEKLPRHGHRRPFLGVLASAGGYLFAVAPQVGVGAERTQDVVGTTHQELPEHLVALLGGVFLTGVPLLRPVGGGHQPQVRPHRAALLEAVGILQGEHECECRERPDPLDLAQVLRFRVMYAGSERWPDVPESLRPCAPPGTRASGPLAPGGPGS